MMEWLSQTQTQIVRSRMYLAKSLEYPNNSLNLLKIIHLNCMF